MVLLIATGALLFVAPENTVDAIGHLRGARPEELRQAADTLVPLILAGGSVKTTVRMMDDAAAEDVLRRLSEFCDVAIASLTTARN